MHFQKFFRKSTIRMIVDFWKNLRVRKLTVVIWFPYYWHQNGWSKDSGKNRNAFSHLNQPRGELYKWIINNVIIDLLNNQHSLWWCTPLQHLTARILYRPTVTIHNLAHHYYDQNTLATLQRLQFSQSWNSPNVNIRQTIWHLCNWHVCCIARTKSTITNYYQNTRPSTMTNLTIFNLGWIHFCSLQHTTKTYTTCHQHIWITT